jgi:hypothetical protein
MVNRILSVQEQVDCTLSHWWEGHHDDGSEETEYRAFVIIQRRNRVFLPGDIAVMYLQNGSGSRQPVDAITSRGFIVRRYYVDYSRTHRTRESEFCRHDNRTHARILVLPDGLQTASVFDPALRALLVSAASERAACPVRADSGALRLTKGTLP